MKPTPKWIKQPYTYTAREFDPETGLYYYRARYYDAKAGRFITRDPIGFGGGLNKYVYVKNRPTIFIDPSGLTGNLYFYTSGTWNKDTTIKADLGQIVVINVKNVNILGTTIKIESNHEQFKQSILPPQVFIQFRFSIFDCEPVYWKFDISSESDAFIVLYEIRSSWIPGMPTNR